MIHKKIIEDTNQRYNISFNKSDNLDLTKFYEVKNKKGRKQKECDVIILYSDEFDKLQQLQEDNNALKKEEEEFKTNLDDLNYKIKQQQAHIKQLQEHNKKLATDNIHQLDKKQLEHQEEIHQLKEEHHQEKEQLKQQHYQELMQKEREYNTQKEQLKEEYYTQKDKIKDNILALRINDQRHIDTMITDIKNLTLMQRIRKKQFNKILDEMKEQNQMLPLPDFEDFQQ